MTQRKVQAEELHERLDAMTEAEFVAFRAILCYWTDERVAHFCEHITESRLLAGPPDAADLPLR